MAVQKMGQAKPSILVMNSGGWPDGGWWRAQYVGPRRGFASQLCSHSFRALSFAACLRAAMVGRVCWAAGLMSAAAVEATSMMCLSGRKLAVPGIHLMKMVRFG
jgi:hypothetical protein